LVNYLLGKLTEDEQVRIEDRAFADRDYMGALHAAEADLIDDYVRGDLAVADRRDFERQFLVSPHRRNKIEFAQALARVTDEPPPVGVRPPAPTSRWFGLFAPFRVWTPAMRFAGALGAVICVAGSPAREAIEGKDLFAAAGVQFHPVTRVFVAGFELDFDVGNLHATVEPELLRFGPRAGLACQ